MSATETPVIPCQSGSHDDWQRVIAEQVEKLDSEWQQQQQDAAAESRD